MLDRICVAVDDSDRAAGALPVAYDLAARAGARVTLLHVTGEPADEPLGHAEQVAADLLGTTGERRWQMRLRGLAAQAPGGVDVDAVVAIGNAVQDVPLIAIELGADLVVAGAPARRGPLGALRGSVARSLVWRAPCPVLLVPRPPPGGLGAQPGAANGGRRRSWASSWSGMQLRASLLARLFAANAFILVLATLLLIVSPLTVSSSVVLNEVLVVTGGLVVMLAADFALLRRTLAPLREITSMMRSIDPLAPGRRLPAAERGGAEVQALAEAFNGMLDRLETERRQSARRALAAQEDERLRIARELHDQVGQTLTAIAIQAERASALGGPADAELLAQLASGAESGVEEVRRISRELRPEALDDLGLVNALIALCSRVASQSGVRIERDLGQGKFAVSPLAPEVELVLYRIAQESLTNAIRHAAPTAVLVALRAAPGGVELVVRDDGRGLPDGASDGDTAGLSGMRERAMLVGGSVEIRGAAGGGTEVRAFVPEEVAA